MRGVALRLALLALLGWGGAHLYRTALAPDPAWLSRLAEGELKGIFGPKVRTTGFRVDLVDGVEVQGLEVRTAQTPAPTLRARRVEVRHDLLDLASGVYRPRRLEIDGAEVSLHETDSGVGPDFPFRLASRAGHSRTPEIVVRGSTLRVRARPGSERLAAGRVLLLTDLNVGATRAPGGRLAIRGDFTTEGLGQDGVRVPLEGWADPDGDALEVHVVWDPLTINAALLDALAAPLAEPFRNSPLKAGRLEATLTRTPPGEAGGAGGAEGGLSVGARWLSELTSDVTDLPGLKDLPADEKARVKEILGGGVLDLAWEQGALVVRALTGTFGGGTVTASGRVEQGGESLDLRADLRGLRLDDPGLRRVLGGPGRGLFDEMEASGTLDAEVHLSRRPGQDLAWAARVTLVDARLLFRGKVDAQGRGDGFPYALEHAHGTLRVSPEGVEIDGIEGRHGERTVMRVLSTRRPSWTGDPSGYVRFGQGGGDLCVTVEALDVPVDDDLVRAVDGSELAGLLDTYRVTGVIDRIEADVVRRPAIDPAARVEVRVTVDGERLTWSRFPVPLEDVRGIVTLRRPALAAPGAEDDPGAPAVRRGRTVLVDLRASVPQDAGTAAVAVHGEADLERARGRLRVTGVGVALDGPLGATVLGAPLTAGGVAKTWRWLAPRGQADLVGDFPLEDDPGPIRIEGRLRGAAVTADAPAGDPRLDLEALVGQVEVEAGRVRFEGLKGTLLGAALTLDGRFEDGIDGPWSLDVRSLEPLPLTPEVLERVEALSACSLLLPAGMRLEPGGRAGLDLRVGQQADAGCVGIERMTLSDVDASVAVAGGTSLRLRGTSLTLEHGEVRAHDLTVLAPGAQVRVADGRLGPGGLTGRFTLRLDGLRFDDEVLGLVPEDARAAVRTWTQGRRLTARALTLDVHRDRSIGVGGDLAFVADADAPAGGAPRGALTFTDARLSPPDPLDRRTLSGTAVLDHLALDQGVSFTDLVGRIEVDRLRLGDDPDGAARVVDLGGRVEGVRFAGLQAALAWGDGLLRLEPITGTLSGGTLAAKVLVHTRAPEAYEGRVVVADLDVAHLRDDLFPTGAAYRGKGTLDVVFSNRSTRRADLLAKGSLKVREGHLGDLPPVANLFLALSTLLPGHTPPSFERLDAAFTLRDEVIHFQHLDLAGPLTTMPGRGTADLTGQVDVTFTPDFIKGMLLPGLVALPLVGDVLKGAFHEELLYAVRVHGDLDSTSTEVIPLPPLGLKKQAPFSAPPPPEPPRRRLPRSFR